jgi:hypothetical protein
MNRPCGLQDKGQRTPERDKGSFQSILESL